MWLSVKKTHTYAICSIMVLNQIYWRCEDSSAVSVLANSLTVAQTAVKHDGPFMDRRDDIHALSCALNARNAFRSFHTS